MIYIFLFKYIDYLSDKWCRLCRQLGQHIQQVDRYDKLPGKNNQFRARIIAKFLILDAFHLFQSSLVN